MKIDAVTFLIVLVIVGLAGFGIWKYRQVSALPRPAPATAPDGTIRVPIY